MSSKIQRRLLWFGLAAAFIMVAILVLPRSTSELEQWKSARRAQGERFTLAEVAPPPSEAVRRRERSLSNAVTRLSVGMPLPDLMQMTTNGFAVPTWRRSNPFGQPSERDLWPEFIEQVKANEPVHREMRELLALPVAGSVYDPANPFPSRTPFNFVARRMAAHSLAGAVLVALRSGRLEAAQSDLLDLLALARASDQGGVLVHHMVQVAIAELAVTVTWEAVQAPHWKEADLAALQAAWQNTELLSELPGAAERERAFVLAAFDFSRTNRAGLTGLWASGPLSVQEQLEEWTLGWIWRTTWSERDELLYLRIMQPVIEGLRTFRIQSAYPALQTRLRESQALSQTRSGLLGRFRFRMTQVGLLNWEKASLHAISHESRRQLALTALALRRFHLAHKQWPESLAQLTPNYLPQIPLDPMTGEPLIYQPRGEAGFVLRSRGENGQDDQGNGDDLIWPQAESPPE